MGGKDSVPREVTSISNLLKEGCPDLGHATTPRSLFLPWTLLFVPFLDDQETSSPMPTRERSQLSKAKAAGAATKPRGKAPAGYPNWSEASQRLALHAGPWATLGKWVLLTSTFAVLGRHALITIREPNL